MSGTRWSEAEKQVLARMWPRREYSRLDILDALAGRIWHSIKHQAHVLGLEARPTDVRRQIDTSLKAHPIFRELRKRREKLNLTRAELGQRAGYSDKTISDWEWGVRVPHFLRLNDWAQALGLKLALKEA